MFDPTKIETYSDGSRVVTVNREEEEDPVTALARLRLQEEQHKAAIRIWRARNPGESLFYNW